MQLNQHIRTVCFFVEFSWKDQHAFQLKRKRDERRLDISSSFSGNPAEGQINDDSITSPPQENLLSLDKEDNQSKKPKQHQSPATSSVKTKFSSLFRNNPEIPVLEK